MTDRETGDLTADFVEALSEDEKAWEAEFKRVLELIENLADAAGVEPATVAAEMTDRLATEALREGAV